MALLAKLPSWPEDDGRWDRPAVLFLRNGREALLPELSVREAIPLLELAEKDGLLFGDEIDPGDVVEVGYGVLNEGGEADGEKNA